MAKVIMIQGTMSNAGKSLITAGLCRVFYEDGYRVAPFKSQNMALNSYITENGLEMGRAQAVQAQACKIKPSVYMNPILLKPTTDRGSQVIVNGKAIGTMPAKEYFAYKKKLIPDIMDAFDRLSRENDIIVVEGAGSPAEINLKTDDIVNMGLAKMLDAPVLLVGDIDCGGVFAQLYGTLSLLEEEERARVKGLIINKFRGDRSILEPGIRMLEEKCNKKVFGVIPYSTVDIEDEDSLSSRFLSKGNGALNIYVIRLPKISNFTDFGPLEILDEVNLRYITNPKELIEPDMIILPGTKNTMADLCWLKESGFSASIEGYAKKGCPVMGICGGYQMLGKKVTDENGAEGFGSVEGLGLLDVETYFGETKHTIRSQGKLAKISLFNKGSKINHLGDMTLKGYEIHMGNTSYGERAKCFLVKENGEWDGCVNENVFGTYFHGIFENDDFCNLIISLLCEKKGVALSEKVVDYASYKEEQFALLGDVIRKNLNMEAIYDIL